MTKPSTAATAEKVSNNVGAESAPHPYCEQFQTVWCFVKDGQQAGRETFNQQPSLLGMAGWRKGPLKRA